MSVEDVRRWLGRPVDASAARAPKWSPRTAAGVVTLLGVGVLSLVRIGLNLPAALPISGLYPGALALATVAPALALVGMGLRAQDPVRRVAPLFAGVFGLLTLVAEPAAGPATIALLAGVLAVGGVQMRDRWAAGRADCLLVVAALSAGAAISLAAGLGIEPATLRPHGSRLVLLGIAASPVLVTWDREAVAVGVGVGIAMLALGLSAPFLTGAISLVVGGVVGVSLPLLLFASIGATILVWSSIRTGRRDLALAASILVVAGIPATIPRSLAFLAALLLVDGDGT